MREELRKAREARGMTMQEAARKSGISKSFWSRLEAGLTKPSIEVAGRIAAALGCDPKELFRELAA